MKLLTKVFRDNNGVGYLYDAVTNKIFKVNEAVYKYHEVLGSGLPSGSHNADDVEYKNALRFIKSNMQKGVLGENNLQSCCYTFDNALLMDDIRSNLRMLILEVTQSCNLRCSYCIYSGQHPGYRPHSSDRMTEEVAFGAIDFYKMHSIKRERAVISFYGGEPLLEFDTVARTIEYGRRIFKNKQQIYYITTNGTLINDEYIKWFAKQPDVHMNVTLNGEKEFHDRFRYFPDKKPTYHLIVGSLEKIKNRYPQAYYNRINLLCNYSNLHNLKDIYYAYKSHYIMREKPPVSITPIKGADVNIQSEGRDYYNRDLKAVAPENGSTPMDELFYEYIGELKRGDTGKSFLKELFDKMLYPYYMRPMSRLDKTASLTSVCQPFVNRLIVETSGAVNICERICKFDEFGNVFDGFNFERIQAMLDKYREVFIKNCRKCWALRFCTICFKDVFSSDMGVGIDDDMCVRIKESILNSLRLYCTIMSIDESLLKHLSTQNPFSK